MSLFTNILGPSRDDVWTKIAREIGGRQSNGGLFGKSNLTLDYRKWTILMDHFSRGGKNKTHYTRLRATFLSKTGFLFQIRRKNMLSPVGKFLGIQDMQLGDEFFDEQFIIKANNEHVIKDLLSDEELKNYISYQPKVLLKIVHEETFFFKKGHPDGVDELYFECRGILKNEEIINGLFILFKAMLDRLVVVDLAYENRPNYQPH